MTNKNQILIASALVLTLGLAIFIHYAHEKFLDEQSIELSCRNMNMIIAYGSHCHEEARRRLEILHRELED